MRILFFIHDFRAGGAERVAATLLNEWARRGHDLQVITYTKNPDHYELDAAISRKVLDFRAISSEDFHKLNRLRRGLVFFNRFPMIRESIRSFKPDIVLSFQTKTNIYCLLGAAGLGVPVIVSEHSYRWARSISRRTDILRRIVYTSARQVVVLTNEDLGNYRGLRNISTIPNPNPFHDTPSLRPPKTNTIVAVGRIVELKGFDLLVEAISKIGSERLNGYKVLVVGEGQERGKLEAMVQAYGLSASISFVGQVRDMAPYYRAADIFVLSSRFEGLPMALIEAMAFGCAPIAFDCPVGPRAIITNGKDGVLVPPEDTDAMASAIEKIINSPADRERIGREAIASSSRFSIKAVADEWEKLFTLAVKG